MIEVRNIEGRFCPLIVCDVCGEQISENGCVFFHDPDDGIDVDGLHFAHNGVCATRIGRYQPDGPNWLWEDLGVFLANLVHNTRVDIEKADSLAKSLARVGL